MEKYQLLEVFREIIRVDKLFAEVKDIDVVEFKLFKQMKEYRKQLRIGAENLIKRQRGSGGSAGSG